MTRYNIKMMLTYWYISYNNPLLQDNITLTEAILLPNEYFKYIMLIILMYLCIKQHF